jgi:G3E family GTPase
LTRAQQSQLQSNDTELAHACKHVVDNMLFIIAQAGCQLDAVLTLVDCRHVTQHLDEEKPEDVVNEAGKRCE